ncbi:RluA family pseudouridine synthase [Pararhodospirillum oryzae]|uniref:Pseudouridine synthase n=1 Tax=Pararhodospirillum oryzae TaxID=478448 RepID=A0A512H9Q3_9PROT|nr:RluA family pseudouridine synthase [Pararhodospirillum oryzae]GEO82187.1 pseudouridine synthase [Pararhodospirillum oryzae]
MGVQILTVPEDGAGQRLDRWLRQQVPGVTQGRLEKWLRTGQMRVDGHRATSSQRLEAGQTVRVPPLGPVEDQPAPAPTRSVARDPRREAQDRKALEAAILHQDDHLIVLNKEPGLAVQGGTGMTRHLDDMLKVLAHKGEVPRLVHRLDKDTSGVLVLARTQAAARFLTAAFRGRETLKVYWALVVGCPALEQGTIRAALAKEARAGGERMAVNEDDGRPAITDYRVIDQARGACAWVELRPRTGRTHQLRVHCLEMGTPILGDGKYAGQGAQLPGLTVERRLHLHARALAIPHPKGGVVRVIAPPPPHFAQSLSLLGFALADAGDPFSGWEAADGRRA